jgi:transposase
MEFTMSLRPRPVPPVAEDTARVARAAFPGGNPYLALRDELGVLFSDQDFAHLYPARGQPAEAPWRLALVTVLQFAENLSDRQAADAVRGRIDWKYALGLERTDPGFDSTVLCAFRARLIAGSAEQRLLDAVLDRCRERNWLKPRGRPRTDSTQVLARVRALNRLECVCEALRHALNSLAVVAPEWLRGASPAGWAERYGRRFDDHRRPAGAAERVAYAEQVGQDGYALLAAALGPTAPAWLRDVPAVQTLRRVWVQQFYVSAGRRRWRTEREGLPPSAAFVSSPYDTEARYAKKGTTSWVGYKVHLTETCDDDSPHLITHVATTAGPVADGEVTPRVHQALRGKGLLPGKHLVDTGYLDAGLLVRSEAEYGVDLIGPTRPDYRWQARAGEGFAASEFRIDWEARRVTCPEGRASVSWTPAVDRGHNPVIKVKFSVTDGQSCPSRASCATGQRRSITLRPREQYLALQEARSREGTEEFRAEYARRAGVEGTISEGVRSHGLRRSRYVGAAKTHFQHLASAAAMNVARICNWLMDRDRSGTRTSAYERLMTPPASN